MRLRDCNQRVTCGLVENSLLARNVCRQGTVGLDPSAEYRGEEGRQKGGEQRREEGSTVVLK